MMVNNVNLSTKIQEHTKESDYSIPSTRVCEELEANTIKPELLHLTSSFEGNHLKIFSQNMRSIMPILIS